MAEFFRFWQRLPRLAFGLASLIMFAMALLGLPPLPFLLNTADAIVVPDSVVALSVVFFSLLLLAAGAIGLFLLDLLVSTFAIITARISRNSRLRRPIRWLNLAEAFMPPEQVVLEAYKRDRDQLLAFFRLRSESTPGHQKNAATLKRFYGEVGQHLDHIADPSLLSVLAYYTSLTQDQVRMEQWELAIKDFYYFLLFLLSTVVCSRRVGASEDLVISLAVILLIALIFALPVIRDRKRRFASLILCAYCDNFTFAEGATIEDRSEV